MGLSGCVAFACVIVAALASSGPEVSEDGDLLAERAEVIAQSCAACHGTGGRLDTAIPSLAGQPAAVLSAQLLAFKRDQMPGATVMPRLARGYSDEELEAVANYFASLTPDADE